MLIDRQTGYPSVDKPWLKFYDEKWYYRKADKKTGGTIMETLCGADCGGCLWKEECKGCKATDGSPFGGKCIAAEHIKIGGMPAFEELKKQIMSEINELGIAGMPEIRELYCLRGSYVNLEYPLPCGSSMKFLKDEDIYLGAQIDPVFDEQKETKRCYGIVAGMGFILVCEYGDEGSDPEIIMYKRR